MHVGIVIPAWNVAPYLADTIRSVLAQTHPRWQMVIVDDGSTDATVSVAAMFPDPRITLLHQPNAGVSAARNRGFTALDPAVAAVLFLDGDDWLAPNALSRLVAGLRAIPEAVAAVGPYAIAAPPAQGPAPRWMPLPAVSRPRYPPTGNLLMSMLQRNVFANCGHVLIQRSAAEQVGPFRGGLTYGEDWDYLVRLALLGPFALAPRQSPVLHVRIRRGGACHRLAADPDASTPCLEAIFTNPALLARFGPARLAWLRARAEAESHWVIGRELIRHGMRGPGRTWLCRSLRAMPGLRRMTLFAAAHALSLLPESLRGPFAPYESDA